MIKLNRLLLMIILITSFVVPSATSPSTNLDSSTYTVREVQLPYVKIGGDDIWVNETGDTMTGNLDMGSNRIFIGDATLYDNGSCFFIDYDGTGSLRIGSAC